jgi:hypothetical protein
MVIGELALIRIFADSTLPLSDIFNGIFSSFITTSSELLGKA